MHEEITQLLLAMFSLSLNAWECNQSFVKTGVSPLQEPSQNFFGAEPSPCSRLDS